MLGGCGASPSRLCSRSPCAAMRARPRALRIGRVVDGDTVYLTSGAKIRLVQIDTPEVYFGVECYGPQASAATERLLPPGTAVRLAAEPATDRVDAYGRLLRYVIRVARRPEREPVPRRPRRRRPVLLRRPPRPLRRDARRGSRRARAPAASGSGAPARGRRSTSRAASTPGRTRPGERAGRAAARARTGSCRDGLLAGRCPGAAPGRGRRAGRARGPRARPGSSCSST